MKFAERLKELRQSKGLTQKELGHRLGISNSAISMYERGEREPDYDTLDLIGDFFNVNVSYLMGEEDGSMYYLDPEAAELAKEIANRDELRILFDATRDISKEDIDVVIRMVEGLKK